MGGPSLVPVLRYMVPPGLSGLQTAGLWGRDEEWSCLGFCLAKPAYYLAQAVFQGIINSIGFGRKSHRCG